MNGENLMEIKGLHLIAGKAGLTRKIRWIYFSDTIANLDIDFNVDEWAREGELIVLTNSVLLHDPERMENFMRRANEIRCAGVIVNIDQSTPFIQALAEELEMPLFELSYELHLVDLSQYICKLLVQEEQKECSLDELLHKILYDEHIQDGEIIRQGNFYGLHLAQSHRMLVFEMSVQGNDQTERAYILYREELLYRIKRELRMRAEIDQCMMRDQGNSILVLLPTDKMTEEEMQQMGSAIIEDFRKQCEMPVCIGVGRPYHAPSDWRTSYEEAKEALMIAKIRRNTAGMEFFNDTSLYSLIMHVQSEKYLENYMNRYLKPLIEADKINEGQLLDTLGMYLECDGNANAAAEALFIHRNTMRYRLEKIKSILKINLNDLEVCFKLNMALCIKQYLDYRNRDQKENSENG